MDSVTALVCHPDTPARWVAGINVSVRRHGEGVDLCYVVDCASDRLILPSPQKPYRADQLWQHTCFELFVRAEPPGYDEFNFSPSSQWAAYSFASYREEMEPLALDVPPTINLWDEGYCLMLSALLRMRELRPLSVALSAVIEEADGTKSYWALAHPPGAPDFHHPDCFALELPALSSPSSPRT